MKISQWKNGSEQNNKGIVVYINPNEAYRLVAGLMKQLQERNPNSGRVEFLTEDNEYFSVAVDLNKVL